MNKRDQYIKNWIEKNRPDLSFESHIEPALDNQAISCLIAISFEAGREFQKDNPKAEFSPMAYVEGIQA